MSRIHRIGLIGAEIGLLMLVLLTLPTTVHAVPAWTSPNRCRLLLNVTISGAGGSCSPASCNLDFQQLLDNIGAPGTFDQDTIEVVAYDALGQPVTYDASRSGYERYLLPYRLDSYYGVDFVKLNFVVPQHANTALAVYFDTRESGLGKPQRYSGLVGDGDHFSEEYKRREINANIYDTFCDFDGDGDLDLFKGSREPYVYVCETVGGNKFVDRGRLTSGGSEKRFPYELGSGRSVLSVECCDWDNDGQVDLFIHFAVANSDGVNYTGHLVAYRNVTQDNGGVLTFQDYGPVRTVSGKKINSEVTFVDWDNDGDKDILCGVDDVVTYLANTDTDGNLWTFSLADGVFILANGTPIEVQSPRIDCADIDTDGDLDLFVGMQDGKVYWFTNVGTRSAPVFMEGRIIAFYEGGYHALSSNAKVADFDGDGLLDFVVGRVWENTHWAEQPRLYGRLYKNVGTPTAPVFEARDAYNGAPYTERFQQCDAMRQSGIRAVDWNNDGKTDLIASDEDGFVWYFRNLTNNLSPLFAAGEKLMAGGEFLQVIGEEERRVRDGYARTDICDWNNDGRKDLLVADGRGYLWLYLNEGTDGVPVLAAGTRLSAYNQAGTQLLSIDGTARSSVMVCDWNYDGKKDVVHAITGQGNYSVQYNWPWQGTDPTDDSGFLFFENIGSDASPVLKYPKWVTDEHGTIIDYPSRPNLGSYVDWDGDGKKDFIAAEFENSVRFYRNIGSASGEPVFDNADGVFIVKPFTVQMISGADAKDWNGDGDLDILTGEGHGASGLRFYERDYIDDFVNDSYPTVTTGSLQQGLTVAQAKSLPDGSQADLPQGIVSAAFSDFFYIESLDRVSGIRVEKASHTFSIGDMVSVSGPVLTNASGERYIAADSALEVGASDNVSL